MQFYISERERLHGSFSDRYSFLCQHVTDNKIEHDGARFKNYQWKIQFHGYIFEVTNSL